MGNYASAFNAAVLDRTAGTVANWRQARISPDFTSGFNGGSSGWADVNGAWFQEAKYIGSLGTAGTSVSMKKLGTFGDITYTAVVRRAGDEPGDATRLIVRGNAQALTASNAWKSSYAFNWTNSKQFSIVYYNAAGNYTFLKDWTVANAIKPGLYNTIEVQAVGTILRFKINGVQVATVVNSSLRTGQIGFGMYRSSGSGTIMQVDNVTVKTTPTADVPPNLVDTPAVQTKSSPDRAPRLP
jgi:hypothetical protein